MSQLTLNLPDRVAAELMVASREANLSPEGFAEDVVRRALSVRKIREAQATLNEYGKAAGFDSDEDVFKAGL